MGKLYGQDLEDALDRRKQAQEDRKSRRMTLRKAAKVLGKEMGLTPEEYVEWEGGVDICPHEVMETIWAGFPPKFFIDRCTKCTYYSDIRSIEDEEAFQDYLRTNPKAIEPLNHEWQNDEA